MNFNLLSNMVTGSSRTEILHILIFTPIEWYSKTKNTIETSIYGIEFLEDIIGVYQIVYTRITIRYFSVRIE